MWTKNQSFVISLNTLTHISLLAVVVTAITSGSGQSYHKLKAVNESHDEIPFHNAFICVSLELTLAFL